MKKILVLASVIAAISLVACGDDSGSSGSSKSEACLVKAADGSSIHCYEVEGDAYGAEYCGEEAEGMTGATASLVSECPSAGVIQTCVEDYDAVTETYFEYTNDFIYCDQ